MRTCSRCGAEKPIEEFQTPRSNNCNVCRTEAARIHRSKWRLWKDEISEKRRHGLTYQEYLQILDRQGGMCAGCGAIESGNKKHPDLYVDHDHTCCPGPLGCPDCIRGLVCHKCNLIAGEEWRVWGVVAYLREYAERKKSLPAPATQRVRFPDGS